MAIVTAYVYSPFSNQGRITGRTKYCITTDGSSSGCTGSGTSHGACNSGYGSPVDIGASGNLYLRVTTGNIKSCKTRITTACCSSTTCGENFKRTIIVELYTKENALCLIGSVAFGHVTSPQVGNGSVYNFSATPPPILLGTATTGSCTNCSSGAHSHMEVKGGTVVAPCCNATVTSGTSIYKFSWDNSIQCPEGYYLQD